MDRRSLLAGAAMLLALPKPAAAAPTRFTVKVSGAGADVILIPGLLSSGEVWDATAARLSMSRRVHVVTLAGFAGASAGANAQGEILGPFVEELAGYIRAGGLKDVAVIGHSMGGLSGNLLAGRHPELVSRLMVVDSLPLYWLMMGPNATVERFRAQSAAARDTILAMSAEQFAQAQGDQVSAFAKSREAQDRILRWAVASDRAVGARVLYEAATTDARPVLPRITADVRVLYACDPPTPPAALDAMYASAYAGLAKKRLVRIDGSRHFIMYDQPGRFAAEVDGFLG
jgi:pimeloyl-ACP methyl ester carboxylesterase